MSIAPTDLANRIRDAAAARARQPADTQATPADIEALDDLLYRCRGWMRTIDIRSRTGWSERRVRAVAAEVPAIASSQGYRHLTWSEPWEIEHALRRMRAVGRGTLEHADRLEESWRAMRRQQEVAR